MSSTQGGGGGASAPHSPGIVRQQFGLLPSGEAAQLFTLTNRTGMSLQVTDYGGIIVAILAPDRGGGLSDIVLGHDSLRGYLHNTPYFGALIGRVANRIGGAEFTIDGESYRISANDGRNALHGGARGFDQALWTAASFEREQDRGVKLALWSRDGDQGFPGNLHVEASYTLNDLDEISIEYAAECDRATLVNLTQHSYFNLSGRPDQEVLDHAAWIDADRYLPVDAELIPSGALADVTGSAFDFRSSKRFGESVRANDPQIESAQGYDHNFVLNKAAGEFALCARVLHDASGRLLEVSTSEPGLQLYTGNQLDGSITGKAGVSYKKYAGFALETQHFPDAPHHPEFPSILLRPGLTHRSRTVYRFATNQARG